MFLLFFFFKRRSAGDINKIPLNFATAGMPFEQAQEIFSYAKSQATALGVIIPPPRHCSRPPQGWAARCLALLETCTWDLSITHNGVAG